VSSQSDELTGNDNLGAAVEIAWPSGRRTCVLCSWSVRMMQLWVITVDVKRSAVHVCRQ